MTTSPPATAPSRHYVALDGLRGFAALSVVLFHLGHWLDVPWLATNASLAVDLFFCLSGYVLPLAYGRSRAPDLGFARFARIRLVRLMPLIALAIMISALYLAAKLASRHEAGLLESLAAATALGLVVLPYFHPPQAIGGPQIFPLNGPEYSLFLELVVNAAWFATRRMAQLPLALALAAVSLALIALFGSGGDTAASFWLGFPRVFASYFIGVALFHLAQGPAQALAHSRGAHVVFWLASLAMATLFFWPAPSTPAVTLAWIAIVSPLLVFTGAGAAIGGLARRLCLATGALSYPIYALHYPVFCWLNGTVQTASHRQVPALEVPLAFATIVAASAVALIAYDEPLRAALSRRFKSRRVVVEPAPTAALRAP